MALTYNPEVFRVSNMQQAREIILTTEEDVDTETRWKVETPYIVDLIQRELSPRPGALVVDFGCGIGRLAKALIEKCGCFVLGVDISPDMRSLAPHYVASDNFSVLSPATFARLVAGGLRAEAAFSVWVIQHCLKPGNDLDLIRDSLRPGARFALVNSESRVVPVKGDGAYWANDGVSVRALVAERFKPVNDGLLDRAYVGDVLADCSFWASYQKA